MALVSKAKAAKLAGVSRTTIHRYVTDGKLSMTGEQVDTSELMRVFGSLTVPKSEQVGGHVQDSTTGQRVTTGGQGAGQAQIDLMERVIDDLRADRDNWRNKADELVELLRNEQENTKLLTHQSPATNKAESFAVVMAAGLAVVIVGVLVWLALA
jgi:hypothetical protein